MDADSTHPRDDSPDLAADAVLGLAADIPANPPIERSKNSPHDRPPQPWNPWKSLGIVAGVLLAGGVAIAVLKPWSHLQAQGEAPPEPALLEPTTVTALGVLEPVGEVIALAAPASASNSRVDRLLVQEGDTVQGGQVVALLDGYPVRKAALVSADQAVQVAAAQLAQVQAGAKGGQVAAQQAEVARLEAEQRSRIAAQEATLKGLEAQVHHSTVEWQRYEQLYQEGAVAASDRDARQLTLEAAQANLLQGQAELERLRTTRSPQLVAAQARLAEIAEVRPVDVAVAQSNLQRAEAQAQQAAADLAQMAIVAPRSGVVLEILSQGGERIAPEGLLTLGQVGQMYARAEVYESDVGQIALGQRATVTSEVFDRPLAGVVDRIGSQVKPQSVISVDPTASIDARIVEVWVRLDPGESALARPFTHLQVSVSFAL